ncbi:MAG: hypothetical protein MUE74_09865, partial [Bacteroidales bacterium]|nr:hypothetical protein [Bacteroidales bacterium]
FDNVLVTSQRSQTPNRLRGIPYRSSYPGSVTATPATTTVPTSYAGGEYMVVEPGPTNIVAKDTVLKAGQTTMFTVDANFERNKYYTIVACDLMAGMTPLVIEDQITSFTTPKKVKMRVLNVLYGVAANEFDLWLIHQPATAELGRPPYQLVTGLDYKTVSEFTDTITAGSYKWAVTVAGTVPTAITAPTPDPNPEIGLKGKAYTITFPAGSVIIAPATAGTAFGEKYTYTLLVFGQFGKTSVIAPYGGLFRNRLM